MSSPYRELTPWKKHAAMHEKYAGNLFKGGFEMEYLIPVLIAIALVFVIFILISVFVGRYVKDRAG